MRHPRTADFSHSHTEEHKHVPHRPRRYGYPDHPHPRRRRKTHLDRGLTPCLQRWAGPDQAQALCDDTSFATMRNTLGLDTFDLAVAIDNPTARTYTIARKFSQAWTLVNITAGTDQGTLTLNVRKSGTSVTSLSAVSVSSTYGDTSATANNAFTTTDYLDFVLSSVSGSPNELVVTIHYTR